MHTPRGRGDHDGGRDPRKERKRRRKKKDGSARAVRKSKKQEQQQAEEESKVNSDPLPVLDKHTQAMLDANGISGYDYRDRPEKVRRIEIFQVARYKQLLGVERLTGLVHLEVILQGLTKISGLETLVNLERLYLTHNRIQKIEGLQNCVELRELYIDKNQISKIEGLDTLVNLRVLALYDNRITTIEGLDNLTLLTHVHLARNRIQEIGSSFDHLVHLEELNLSDNLVGSFSQIRNLTRLKQLQILYLNDPHFGDNPVCNLCNYHTYALYHMQHLEILDSIRLSEEATQLAEATYLKKQMYYNMRIKMCKRNTTNVLRKAHDACKKRIRHIAAKRKRLVRELKAIQRELDEVKYPGGQLSMEQRQLEYRQAQLYAQEEPSSEEDDGDEDEKSISKDMIEESEMKPPACPKCDVAMVEKWSPMECSHGFCHKCITNALKTKPECPICGTHVNAKHLMKSNTISRRASAHLKSINVKQKRKKRKKKQHTMPVPPTSPPPKAESKYPEHDLLGKKIKIQEALTKLTDMTEGLDEIYNRFQSRIAYISEQLVSRMILELETGGNVRFEDGRPSDSWFSSCCHFLNSHFDRNTFPIAAGIKGLRVRRVTKIHNRFLRNRFEERLESLPQFDPTNNNRQRPDLQYLFHTCENPDHPSDMFQLLERGFLSSSEYLANGKDGGVPLTNAVGSNDIGRITRMLAEDPGSVFNQACLNGGYIIIAKVYLGIISERNYKANTRISREDYRSDSVFEEINRTENDDRKHSEEEEEEEEEEVVEEASTKGKKKKYGRAGKAALSKKVEAAVAKSAAIIKSKAAKRFFVFDRAMVLPEYIVSFDYVRQDMAHDDEEIDPELTKVVGNFIGLKDPLIDFTASYFQHLDEQKRSDITHQVLSLQPSIEARPTLDIENPPPSSVLAQPRLQSKIAYLNFHDCKINMLANLDQLSNLRVLILTFNNIASIHGLQRLKQLERLELSYNSIRQIGTGLTGLTKLKHLELDNNLLHAIQDIEILRNCVPNLEVLSLKGNSQLNRFKNYRQYVLSSFPRLQLFDENEVGASDREALVEASACVEITTSLIREHAFLDREAMMHARRRGGIGKLLEADNSNSGSRSRGLGVYTRMRMSEMISLGHDDVKDDRWWSLIVELELDHQRLGRISNLERLSQLRKASLCDNELRRIEGLEHNLKLEELCLEENRITKLENLSHFRRLLKLDLGKNQISVIENLDSLTTLSQLSLEDNNIRTLNGLQNLSSLMELYIGNNRLTQLKEVTHLRALPKLLILDLSGNPICQLPDYRAYVIFNLKKLKVLDGVGIDAAEQSQAKEMYAGKLTDDMLNEILGHNYYQHIENLDLSTSRIRILDVVTAERFANLHVLVLDNNHISDISTLSPLSLLRVLRLNKNRISSMPVDHDGRGYLGKCFPHLEVLELGNNRISSISALHLQGLSELRVLTLEGNEIQRIDGLYGLPNLQQLVLAKNKIKRIDPKSFVGLNELRGLQLEENGLRSLAHLGPLPKIRSLFLAYNRLPELSELEHLVPDKAVPLVTEITLRNNPMARKHLYRNTIIRKIPSLTVIDGKDITHEEREKTEAMFMASEQQYSHSPIYYYANDQPTRHTDKVPIKLQSFTLAGFCLDSNNSGGSIQSSPYSYGYNNGQYTELNNDNKISLTASSNLGLNLNGRSSTSNGVWLRSTGASVDGVGPNGLGINARGAKSRSRHQVPSKPRRFPYRRNP